MTVYTDGNGTYFEVGNVELAAPSNTIVNTRTTGYYTSISIETSLLPTESWSIAPNLTDIGGGVWFDGLLVDPSYAASQAS